MQERLVRFSLFGQEFVFYSDAAEEEVAAVLTMLREELEGQKKISRSTVPSNKILVLGCLRMTAKYIHLQREHAGFRQSQEQGMAALSDKISMVIESPD